MEYLIMNTYKIMLEIVSDTPPDWIVPSIEVQLNADESIKYFDYKIDNEDNQFIKDHFQFIRVGD